MTHPVAKNRVRELLPANWSDIEGVVEQFFGPTGFCGGLPNFVPVSLWEDPEAYHVELDVPGVPRENIALKFENGSLVITTERPTPEETRRGVVEERRYGKSTRTIALPDSVDSESIEARLADGVLHVAIAKRPEALTKSIEIK